MGNPRIQIIALVGAGAISSSAIFCFFLMYFLPDPSLFPEKDVTEAADLVDGSDGAAKEEETDPAVLFAQAVTLLNDEDQPLTVRRRAAFALAEQGTKEALLELLLTASTASPFVKTAIADALVRFKAPDARRLLVMLLRDEEEMVGRAAIRSLVGHGDDAAIHLVGKVLRDRERPMSLRAEAAQALGRSDHPDAAGILMDAIESASGYADAEPVFYQVVEALASKAAGDRMARPAEQPMFWPSSSNVAEESTAGFLVDFLADSDPAVRQTAARSLNGSSMQAPYAPAVFERLRRESEAEVRAHLYRALEGSLAVDGDALLETLRRESDYAARMAGYNLLASAVSIGTSARAVDFFNDQAIPELRQAALQGEDVQMKLLAIIALQRARTGEAREALREIARSARDRRVKNAALAATDGGMLAPYATKR